MNYVDFYLQARSASDKIAEVGGFKTPSRETANGFIARKPKEAPAKTAQTDYADMIVEYMQAVRELPSPPKENQDTPDVKEKALEPFGGSGKPLTSNQKLLLAKTLQAEAGNQGFQGMVDVGSVIANRAASGKYGKGIEGVIMKPGQFSAWNSVTGYAKGEQGQNMDFEPSEEAMKAAELILSGQYEDKTGGATNYFAIIPGVSERPKWANENFKKRGDHYFGKA